MSSKLLDIERRGSAAVATIIPKTCLDPRVVDELGAELGVLAAQPFAAVALDFGRVEFLSPLTLRPLVRLNKVLKRRGVRLTLCRLEPQLRDVFRITRLDQFFSVRESVEEALAEAAEQPAPNPVAACAVCTWPRQGQCKACRVPFCEAHGYGLGMVCRRHRWSVWGPFLALLAAAIGAAAFCLWGAFGGGRGRF
jgi:anti-sigma B factor antagonist